MVDYSKYETDSNEREDTLTVRESERLCIQEELHSAQTYNPREGSDEDYAELRLAPEGVFPTAEVITIEVRIPERNSLTVTLPDGSEETFTVTGWIENELVDAIHDLLAEHNFLDPQYA